MKKLGMILLAASIVFSPALLHAQTAFDNFNTSGGFNDLAPVQSSTPDSIVQITAEAEGLTQVDSTTLPPFASCWWTVFPGTGPLPMPIPPQDLTVPIYEMADGIYLVDETGGAVSVSTPQTYGMQAMTSSAVTSAVERQGNAIANLIEQVQETQYVHTMAMAFGMDIPFPGDGGGETNLPADSGLSIPDYGTNLWVAETTVAGGSLAGIGSNTTADVQYEIQSRTNLVQSDWQSEGFIWGSELTNWTALSVPQLGRTNLFIRLKSWADDGSGLPIWWQIEFFGTNGVDPYGDPSGDGYDNYYKFEHGMDPTQFYSPAAPQGLASAFKPSSNSTSLAWLASEGAVASYTIEKNDSYYDSAGVYDFSVSAPNASFSDDLSVDEIDPYSGSYDVSYRIRANYSNGSNSIWSAYVPLQSSPMVGIIFPGSNGLTYLSVSGIPADAAYIRLIFFDDRAIENNDNSFNYSNDIPVVLFTNGICTLPSALTPPASDPYGPSSFETFATSVSTNGEAGGMSLISAVWSMPFYDGRVQMKQNLTFQFRAAPVDGSFNFEFAGPPYDFTFSCPTNYCYSGLYDFSNPKNPDYFPDAVTFDPFLPFENNYLFFNFVFQSGYIDGNGYLATGLDNGDVGGHGLVNLSLTPAFQFQTNLLDAPAVLSTNDTRWLYYAEESNDTLLFYGTGILTVAITTNNFHSFSITNTAFNWFGLPYLSANIQAPGVSSGIVESNVVTPAHQVVAYVNLAPEGVYPETKQPQYQTVEYDFWSPDSYSYNPSFSRPTSQYPLPGDPSFDPASQNQPLFFPVGKQSLIAGYAKLAVNNSVLSGIYGYLGQYFDMAYKVDTNGNVTATNTGVLSPYGDFFATEAGRAALVTMPDIDTGQRGTDIVYCVSLQVDKNHDGAMDSTFNGPDMTSQASPMVWWINDDYDYSGASWDLGHDVEAGWYYNDGYQRKIDSQRDLEDYARLWICGMPALTNGNYQVTLSWANVSNGNPTINLFDTVETNGGIGYLTNLDTATAEAYNYGVWGENRSAIATISPGQPFTIPASYFTNAGDKHFLFDGAITNGAGELLLTIADGNGNTIAQTGVWVDLHDVKDFYERAVITNNISSSSISNWTSGIEVVQQATASALGDDTNLIVLVHGINVADADWLVQSDTVFKRLYWAGYRGKFMSVKWPCNYLTPPQPLTIDVFNLSEAEAYKASTALTTYLNQLRSRFQGYRLNLLVHSQGNAVASEAIKNGAPFDTYILTQGAISDGAYDVNATNFPDFIAQEVGTHITPEWQPMGYRGIYTNSNFAGKIVNFYNPQDGVLAIWQTDQIDDKPSGNYSYDGTDCWLENFLMVSHLVTDFQETRAMVSRARSLSVGQSGPASAHGVLQSAMDLNAQFGFSTAIAEHSAQWTRPIQTSLPYYSQVLLQIKPLQ